MSSQINYRHLLTKEYTSDQLNKLTKLDLSNNQIENTIDEKAFQNCTKLYQLDLNNNKITRIDGNTFNGLTKLTSLYLYDNKIENIDEKAFQHCILLYELNLNNNKLTIIDSNTFKLLEKLNGLDLSNNKIETINENAFEDCINLTELYFQGNQLRSIDEKTFQHLIKLTRLDLSANQIYNIDENAFKKCTNLYYINLKNNKLTKIYCNTFKQLENLHKLDLSGNKIDIIDKNAFENCMYLNDLNLNNNELTSIDGSLFNRSAKLNKLNLSENRIGTINENFFKNCPNIYDLNINNNYLRRINEKAFELLIKLTKLDLSSNIIYFIDQNSFKNCTNLYYINLKNNKLTNIYRNTFNHLAKLNVLDLSNNLIDTIDNNVFENYINLRELYLQNNELRRIDGKTFEKLTELLRLDLSNNQIESIGENDFGNCTNLFDLNLRNNKLTKITCNIFKRLEKLTRLDMRGNQINNVAENIFDSCTTLYYLNLSNNKFTKLDSKLFKNLIKLTRLDLSGNQIESIDKDTFNNCKNLTELYIQNNKLTRIDRKAFKQFMILNGLDLSNNQIETINKNIFKNCTYLYDLNLNNNKLTRIHNKTLNQLAKLHKLNLSKNQIDTFDENVFENCTNLFDLNLNSNKLKKVDSKLFNQLNKLTLLDISNNRIDTIGENAFDNCTNLEYLNLKNNKLTKIDDDTFYKLSKLNNLLLSINQIKKIEKNSFINLKELKELDLSNNSINHKLNLVLDCCLSVLYFNFSFNNIKKVILKFQSNPSKLVNIEQIFKINISSNDIKSFSAINITSENENCIFEINARFNLIQSIPFDNQIFTKQLNKFKFDLSKNPLNIVSRKEIFKNEIYKDNFTIEIKQLKREYIKEVDFNILKNRYSFIKGLKHWKNISAFSLITGKNGIGKSTVLNYIQELYNQIYLSEYLFKIKEIDDNGHLEINNFFIAVIYRMHEKIKPDIVSIEKLRDLVKEFLQTIQCYEMRFNQINCEVLEQIINIFTVDSIENLILQFKNNLNRINQHLIDFKYQIEINESSNTDSQSICFINRYNPNIKVTSENLSPGEQLMLLFRIWEFALTRYEIPHTPVLLLDEPDAHLHPQAVHEFVNILEKLSEAGAQIIMTTHNPTTVSLVKKENLFCMKSDSNGLVSIEKANSKTEIIRELTNNLILVNEPYRVILVEGDPNDTFLPEPEYKENERDALFYRFVHSLLIESAIKIRDNSFSEFQLVFKSFSGHDNILDFFKRLDTALMYQDHCAIIDNDNFFQICSNQPNEIEQYYANRSKRRFNLLRHSLENYILDPINLFVYLISYHSKRQQAKLTGIRVNVTRLEKFHQQVINEIKIWASLDEFKRIIAKVIKVSDFENNLMLFQTAVTVLGHKLVEYLTQIDGFEYRLFKRKKELNNLTPLFLFIVSQVNPNSDETNFFSIQLLTITKPNFTRNNIIENDSRLEILTDLAKQDEKSSKRINFDEIKSRLANLIKEPFENLKNEKSKFKNLSETFQAVFKSNQFRKSIKHEIKNQEEIRLHILDFIDWINSQGDEASKKLIANIDINELKAYINSKYQFDQLLIDDIKNYLLQTVDCCFFEYENQIFKYPRIFYLLRGHCLEEVIYEMFFNENGEYYKSKLINDLLRDEGVMKTCGYLVPNELLTIFKRIMQVDRKYC